MVYYIVKFEPPLRPTDGPTAAYRMPCVKRDYVMRDYVMREGAPSRDRPLVTEFLSLVESNLPERPSRIT